MAYLESIIGVGIISALILYFSFKLDDEHFVLKILSILTSFILLATVPSFVFNGLNNCEPVINTTNQGGGLTSYTYVDYCTTNATNAGVALINVYYGFLILLFLYITVVVVLKSLEHINETAIQRKQRK